MPSNRRSDDDPLFSRRELVAAIGTGGAATVAGCTVLGQTAPRSLNPPEETDDSPTERVWTFPRGAAGSKTLIQAYLWQAYRVPPAPESADVRFQFGVTVSDHSSYHHDRIGLRLRAPANSRGTSPPADVFVEPPSGGFAQFRTYRENSDTVVSLGDLSATGTLHFDFLIVSESRPTPDALWYEFEIGAKESGFGGESVVASSSGSLPIVFHDE